MDETKNIIKKFLKEFKNSSSRKIFIVISIILLLNISIIGIIIYINFNSNNADEIYVDKFNEVSEEQNFQNIEKNNNEEKIIIYITGEVNKPGVYELKENSRIIDAIEIAEGTTADADLRKINLAYLLSDSEKIEIPSIKQEENGNNEFEDESYMVYDSNSNNSKVNINKADLSELTTLPGIGESTARKIIKYREENGNFKDIEDLKNVSGIGESKYSEIEDFIKIK